MYQNLTYNGLTLNISQDITQIYFAKYLVKQQLDNFL